MIKKVYLTISLILVLLASACSIQEKQIGIKEKKPVVVEKREKSQDPISLASREMLDRRFQGKWMVEGSYAEFEILFKSKKVYLKGSDVDDKENFHISKISWDKNTLQSKVVMPSTNHDLFFKLTILDENTLQCDFSGDARGKTKWVRK